MKNIIHWFFSVTFALVAVVALVKLSVLSALFFGLAAFVINPIFMAKFSTISKVEKDKTLSPTPIPYFVYWIAFIILAGFGGRFDPEFGKKKEIAQTTTQQDVTQQMEQSKNWWEGGTLHKCTNAEWKTATQENKVATCSDWIVTLAKSDGLTNEQLKATISMEQLKQMSENLVKEVSASVDTGVSADDVRGECATYASMYWVILKAKVKENAAK